MSDSNKLIWANSLRAVATFAVVVIHVSSYVTYEFGKISNTYWTIGDVFNSSVRWAVPVFIMLTGAFVLPNYNGDLKSFLIKAFKRILIPFAFWLAVYLLYYEWDNLFHSVLTNQQKVELIWIKLSTGSAVHLWYVYMIIAIYLLIPLFSKWARSGSKTEFLFFLSIWFLLLWNENYFLKTESHFQYNYFTGYIGYLFLGTFLFQYSKVNKWLLYIGFVGAIVATAFITYYLSFHNKKLNETYLPPLTPNICIMSVSIFLIFKNSSIRLSERMIKIVNFFSQYSYGVYLMHILVLALIDDYVIEVTSFNPILAIPMISIACFFISYGLVYLFKKIPYINIFFG